MKTKELRAFCLELARQNAFGANTTDPLTGERWAQTEVVYEKVLEQDERGARKITLEEFQRGFNGLRTEQLFEFTDEAAGKGNVCMPSIFGGAVSPISEVKPMFDIAKATVPEILKKYNELNPDKPVKRFADRKSAETRLRAALKKSVNAATATVAADPKPAKGKKPAAPAAAATKRPRKAREPGAAPQRKSAGPDRSGERYVRHHVAVAGVEYRSVLEAFKALGLPVEKHIKFRAALKTSPEGKATFKHEDKNYNFRLVTAAA